MTLELHLKQSISKTILRAKSVFSQTYPRISHNAFPIYFSKYFSTFFLSPLSPDRVENALPHLLCLSGRQMRKYYGSCPCCDKYVTFAKCYCTQPKIFTQGNYAILAVGKAVGTDVCLVRLCFFFIR